jgi:hypothetical protein
MDVNTRLLRYFAAVAAEGNLTRAAERLFVSQPALTKQIKQLESHLGVRLFTRSQAGMTLTAAGQALAEKVPAVLAGLDQALREAKSAASAAARVGHLEPRRGPSQPAEHASHLAQAMPMPVTGAGRAGVDRRTVDAGAACTQLVMRRTPPCSQSAAQDLYDGQRMRSQKPEAWRAPRERYGNRDESRVDRGALLARPPESS